MRRIVGLPSKGASRVFASASSPTQWQQAITSQSDVSRVLRAQAEGPAAFVRVACTVDGFTTTREESIPLQGIALPVPAGSATVDFGAGQPGTVRGTLSPGAPVIERVWASAEIANGAPPVNVYAPPFARGGTVCALHDGGAVLLGGGVTVALPACVRVPFKVGYALQIANVGISPTVAFTVEWEVFS